jgi:hypothetical protein
MLSGILEWQCGAHFVLHSATHDCCGRDHDGKACKQSNSLQVRRDVCERVILRPIVDQLLAPAVVDEMVREMRTYNAQRIARLRARLKARRAELMSAQPEAKEQAKLLRALPAAAKQSRDQITKGFGGNVVEAGRA